MARDLQRTASEATPRRASADSVPFDATKTEGTPVIDAQGLQKRFGSALVLRDLSLRVYAGEIFGLIGPSGSGKSTVVHLLCGHLRPSGGNVRVLGEEPVAFDERTRGRIGYMPQGFVLFTDLTVRQNVGFAAGLYGLSPWSRRQKVREVLELTELWEARGKTARAISGGMQRRLALAAALVHNPDLLFADEPTANLDPILRTKLWRHFREMADRGKSLLVTTQYIDEAENCDRVGLTYGGYLIAEGQPEELRRGAFGGDVVDITLEDAAERYVGAVQQVPGVREVSAFTTTVGQEQPHESLRLTVDDAQRRIPSLLNALEAVGASIRSVGQYRPSFDEVFIQLIEQHGAPRPPVGALRTSPAPEHEGG